MLLLLMCLCVVGNNANGNNSSGKEFLVTFPENVLNPNKPKQQCIIITTVLSVASVQVTSLSQSINFTEIVNITSAEGGYICLEEGIQLSGSGIMDKVVRIISNNDVNVLAVDFGEDSMDVYLALPVQEFGYSFYVVTYQSKDDKTQFSVTSSSADTSVTIEFPPGLTTLQYNGITILNPRVINVTLQKHEVIQMQNDKDLTGTYVSSTKPVAVIAGAQKSYLDTTKTKDHLAQQMTPVTTWGKHFVSVLSPEKTNTSKDLYRILASTPNTTVHVGGSIYRLEKEGDWLETTISATDPVEVTSNEAILLVKFVTVTKTFDPCMMIVHPNTQWQYQYSFRFPSKKSSAYVIVVIDSSFKSTLMLNSQPLDIQNWVSVMHTNMTSGCILLPKGYYVIQSVRDVFAVYIFQKSKGTGAFCSAVGMNLTPINENWIHTKEKNTNCQSSTFSTPTTDSTTTNIITTSVSTSSSTSTTTATTTSTTPPTTTRAAPTAITTSLNTEAETTISMDTTLSASGADETTVAGNVDPRQSCSCQGESNNIYQNMTLEELQIIIKYLQADLRILPNQTSKAKRRKISAPDDRPSSKTFGATGCTFLTLCCVIMFIGDIPRIIRHLKRAF
ncbi:uncharacterized protein [Haliotis asinina]|uniref:uncharacterized protein n=1 Tax=Haliotis asinina TaxID=109174 RepID=UPI0035327750